MGGPKVRISSVQVSKTYGGFRDKHCGVLTVAASVRFDVSACFLRLVQSVYSSTP